MALSGIFPAIITPFTSDGTLDLAGLKTNFALWNNKGLAGYLVLGSTGEVVHLDEDEKLKVLEVARAEIPADLPMIVGTGLHSTKATIEFTRQAANLGASYALVVTPHYFKSAMTPAVLIDYYRAVADASPIPVLLYSVPQFTGLALTPETIAKLAEHANIVGIKDSSGDMRALIQTLSLVDENFVVLTGSAPIVYPALTVGAQGAILAVANFAPQVCVDILRRAQDQSVERQPVATRILQEKLLQVSEKIASKYGVGGIKSAMDYLGYRGGAVRAPLVMPDEQATNTIRAALSNSGLFENLH